MKYFVFSIFRTRNLEASICDGDDWWTDLCKLQMQADLMESDPGCGMCYTGADEYWQAEGLSLIHI